MSRTATQPLAAAVLIGLLLAVLLPRATQSGSPTGSGDPQTATSRPESGYGEMALALLADHLQADISEPAVLDHAASKREHSAEEASAAFERILVQSCGPNQTHDADAESLKCQALEAVRHWRPDQSSLKGAAAYEEAREIVVEAAGKVTDLRFLVATVPDPVDSGETWQFDPALEGIRLGIEANGYALDRFWLPDIQNSNQAGTTSAAGVGLEHRKRPGVVLFADSHESGERLLVLFLVPETPTAGIHHEPFNRAVSFAMEWIARDPQNRSATSARSSLAGIVGPMFSGSVASLARAIAMQKAPVGFPCQRVHVVSGAASDEENRNTLRTTIPCAEGKIAVDFRAMVHTNAAMRAAIQRFQRDIGIKERTAEIVEQSTGFGVGLSNTESTREGVYRSRLDPLQIRIPYNVAHLRSVGDAVTRRQSGFDPFLPGVLPLSLKEPIGVTDQLTIRTPGTTGAYAELVLRNMIDVLRREKIRAAQIITTDARDRLLLIREIHQRAPDVMIFVADGDLLYSHPEQYQWTAGVVVASSYPVSTIAQPGAANARSVHQFANLGSQGLYNATIVALNVDPQWRWMKDSVRVTPESLLLQYDVYKDPSRSVDCEHKVPPVWFSIVARGMARPVRTIDVCETPHIAEYMFVPTQKREVEWRSLENRVWWHGLQPSGRTYVALMTFLSTAMLVVGICWWSRIVVPKQTDSLVTIAALIAAAVASGDAWWIAMILMLPMATMAPVLLSEGRSRGVQVLAGAAAIYIAVSIGLGRLSAQYLTNSHLVEIETGVSPLSMIMVASALPIAVSAVLCRLRFDRGGMPAAAGEQSCFKRALDAIDHLVVGGTQGQAADVDKLHCDLFHLAAPLWGIVALTVLTTCWAVFHSGAVPVWSVYGASFGWIVAVTVIAAQAMFVVGLLQFWSHWHWCADFLRRVAKHPIGPAFRKVPKELMPTGLLPRRPRLYELQAVLDELERCPKTRRAALESPSDVLKAEVATPRPTRRRWFESRTWNEVIVYALAAPIVLENAKFLATAVLFVIRELLTRLSICLLLAGSSLGVLIGVYRTAPFQASHRLLSVIWVDIGTFIVIAMWAFIEIDRDETLSLVTNTTPGKLNWNLELFSKIAVYALLPLTALFISQFPNLGAQIADVASAFPKSR